MDVYFIGYFFFYFYRYTKQTHKQYYFFINTQLRLFNKYYILIKIKIYCLGWPNCTKMEKMEKIKKTKNLIFKI